MSNKIKVCVIGYFIDEPDEGVRKSTYLLTHRLREENLSVLMLDITKPLNWITIIKFKPDIIHYILSPTLMGLVAAKCISSLYPRAKSIISALHPSELPQVSYIKLFMPDLVLIQSYECEKAFKSLGFRTLYLPNGVDIEKYKPINQETKNNLRNAYGILLDKFVILHVASLKRGRNLEILKEIQRSHKEHQVLIIGRINETKDANLIEELQQAGCIVWIRYIPNIEDIYALSDCYIFPTVDKEYCIETPLSVLEAMSCNLPVITARFGALPRMFGKMDGLLFGDPKDFPQLLDQIKSLSTEIKTRDAVSQYSLTNIICKLLTIYRELL